MATPLAPRDGSLALGIPELRKERSLFSFPVHNLSHIIYGSKENFERKQYLDSLVKGDPAIESSVLPFLSHADRYKRSLQTVHRVLQLKERHNLSQKDYEYLLYSSGEWHSLSLQEVYLGALVNLASDEQLKKYYDDSRSFRIIGCYAQTEIGHGSNVQGLQTTATYLPDEDAFDLHTPAIEATKWWVGALGKSATHAIVFARLILPDGDHGVHGFMLQLRCLKTHKLLPGIVTGDIGPKFGFAGVDNGSLRLNHVKIPRTEMLSRFGSVLPGGKYDRPPHDKLGYAGMTATRVNLAILSGQMLARAATVAVRYSLVRRQGEMNKKEVQIIDYTVQQHRLFTQLANAYALHFSGSHLTNLLETYKKGVSSGHVDLDLLKELHVTSSGLKSACTTIAAEGIEDCRKCCGGHGYSQFGGLSDLFTSFVHTCTAEGDNYILTQQTVRYLRDAFKLNRQGKFKAASPFTKYLEKTAAQLDSEKSTATEAKCFSDPKVLLAAYEHRAARSVSNVVERLEAATKRGLSDVDAWNSVLVEVYHTSMAHCLLLIYVSFLQALEKSKSQPAIYTVLKRLCDLFALHHIEKGLAEFLEDGYFSRKQVSLLKDRSRQLLTEIRRDALGLVDAWDFTDNTLNSALGRYDGNVYETLYNWAQKEPLNRKEVADGVEEYIRPMIQGKLSHL